MEYPARGPRRERRHVLAPLSRWWPFSRSRAASRQSRCLRPFPPRGLGSSGIILGGISLCFIFRRGDAHLRARAAEAVHKALMWLMGDLSRARYDALYRMGWRAAHARRALCRTAISTSFLSAAISPLARVAARTRARCSGSRSPGRAVGGAGRGDRVRRLIVPACRACARGTRPPAASSGLAARGALPGGVRHDRRTFASRMKYRSAS